MTQPAPLNGLTPISVSIHEATRLTSISRSKIYELLGEGKLRSTKIGRRVLIKYSDLESLVSEAA